MRPERRAAWPAAGCLATLLVLTARALYAGLATLLLLTACALPAGPPPPPPLPAVAVPVEPDAAMLVRFQPWATTSDADGHRLVAAFDRALASIAAGFLAEEARALGGGVIGPTHVAEWGAVIAAVRASPYRQVFRWDYHLLPAITRDPTERPAAYHLTAAIVDRSTFIERATGRVRARPDDEARQCRLVTLHEEGGTLKVIGMQRVPERLCPGDWPD